MDLKAPDVLLLASEWPERALLRAQLIEEGYEVVAIDAWPIPKLYRMAGMTPRLIVIDLRGLHHPTELLNEVPSVLSPEHVLVLTTLGSLTAYNVRQQGFNVIERPASIGAIVSAVAALLSRTRPGRGSAAGPRARDR